MSRKRTITNPFLYPRYAPLIFSKRSCLIYCSCIHFLLTPNAEKGHTMRRFRSSCLKSIKRHSADSANVDDTFHTGFRGLKSVL